MYENNKETRMDLQELARKIDKMQLAVQSRTTDSRDERMRAYGQGFSDALDGVASIIRQAREAERMRLRLAKLESDLAQDPEPDWTWMQAEEIEAAEGFAMPDNTVERTRV